MDKIEIKGLKLDNDSLPEAMEHLESGLEEAVLYTVESVTVDMLKLAETDEQLRSTLESVSYTVLADWKLLKIAGISDTQRKNEIKEYGYFREMMHRLESASKKVFLLGGTVVETERFYRYLKEEYPDCPVGGVAAVEEWADTSEGIVNEINSTAPDAVICVISSPKRAQFFMENKDKISASLWYGMDQKRLLTRRHRLNRWLRRHLHRN